MKTRYNKELNNVIAENNFQLQELQEENDTLHYSLEEEKQKNKSLEEELDILNQKLSQINNTTNILKLSKVSSFKSYMDYRAITNRDSKAYKLLSESTTDDNGLRKIDDYYCVAMGTYFGNVGDLLYVETDEGAHWNVILVDIKSDEHTDSTHTYTLSNGCMIEFIVDTSKLPVSIKRSGTVNGLGFQGKITVVKHI